MAYKTKHGKQGYANGNFVLDFDINSLSSEQQAYYNTLDEKGQLAFRNEVGKKNVQPQIQQQVQPQTQQQTAGVSTETAANAVTDIVGSGSTLGTVSGIIGAISSVAEEAAGEQDKYGAYETDIQTHLGKSTDVGGNISKGIEQIGEGDILTGIGNILQLGGAQNVTEDAVVAEAKKKERDALMLTAGQRRSAQSSFQKGGSVPDESDKKPKAKVKERDIGTLNVSAARERELYGDPEGPKPLYTSDEIITGMLQEGYKPFPEERADNIQTSYSMSESDKQVYDAFETKDIQAYITDKLGLDLDDFGTDNVYGKETGEILSRYISQREDIQKIDPIDIKTKEPVTPDIKIQNQRNIDKILYYGPNAEIYQADPNTFGREGAEKNFTRSAERETLQYLTEVAGLDYESSKELMKTEEGRKDLINKFNKSQGFSENLVQAYAQQGNFPIYKKGKLQSQKRIYDDEGNLTLKDVGSLNYREGGSVQGVGTGKSDSIDADLNPGDFVIPTDTPVSNNALKSVMKILDLNHVADTTKGTKEVNISNGEKIIPRDKVNDANELLKRMGYKNGLQDAAPNSEYDFLTYQNII